MFWFAYLGILTLIAISRIFIAAHFPHQVFLAALFGYLVAKLIEAWSLPTWNSKNFTLLAVFLTGLGVMTYYGMLMLGYDPDWTIPLALMHCAHHEWVHLFTTPLHGLIRCIASILALGFSSTMLPKLISPNFSPYMRMILLFALAQIVPKFANFIVEPMWVYYVSVFFLYFFMILSLLYVSIRR